MNHSVREAFKHLMSQLGIAAAIIFVTGIVASWWFNKSFFTPSTLLIGTGCILPFILVRTFYLYRQLEKSFPNNEFYNKAIATLIEDECGKLIQDDGEQKCYKLQMVRYHAALYVSVRTLEDQIIIKAPRCIVWRLTE